MDDEDEAIAEDEEAPVILMISYLVLTFAACSIGPAVRDCHI